MFKKTILASLTFFTFSISQATPIANWTIRSGAFSFSLGNREAALKACNTKLNALLQNTQAYNLRVKSAACTTKVDGFETEGLEGGLYFATIAVEAEKSAVCEAFPEILCN